MYRNRTGMPLTPMKVEDMHRSESQTPNPSAVRDWHKNSIFFGIRLHDAMCKELEK